MRREIAMSKKSIVGRGDELRRFGNLLHRAVSGTGSTLLISGEAGIGKTYFVAECRQRATDVGVQTINGAASSVSFEPFQLFSNIFGDSAIPEFLNQEWISFSEIFLVNRAGLLIAKESNGENAIDADIVAGMMSAVQNFISASLDSKNLMKGGLDKLEYGNMKIMIEHSEGIFLTTVLKGSESSEMRAAMKNSFGRIMEGHGETLASWKGNMMDIQPVQDIIASLAKMKFMVKKDLSGALLDSERNRMSEAIFDAVKVLSEKSPVLIILEDLQWADDSSLAVLNYLARNIAREPVMILGTMRPNESELLSAQLGKMRSEEIFEEVQLRTLDVGDVVSLLNNIFPGNEFPGPFIQNLTQNCAGNPFFITELLKQMGEDGHIRERQGKFTLVSDEYSIPNAVGDFVGDKLDKLEPDVMALLEYASCIGVRFDERILKSCSMLDGAGSALERLYSTGIVTSAEGISGFSHAIFQDAIYQGIANRWRTSHHRSLGEFYEREYADRPTEVLYDLARHFSRSNEHEKAFDYCMRAGEKAEAEFAPVQALELYRNALTAREKVQAKSDAGTAVALHEKVGDLLILVGKFDESLDSYGAAYSKAEDDPVRARLLRKKGEVYHKKGDYQEALKILAEAKGKAGSDRTIEHGRISMLEGLIVTNLGDRAKALDLLEEASSIFIGSSADLRDVGNVFNEMGKLHYRNGNLGESRKCHLQGMDISKLAGNKAGLVSAYNNLGNIALTEGNYDLALEYLKESLQTGQKIGDLSGTTVMLSNIGNTYYRKGDFDLALEYHKKALTLKERFGQKWGIAASNLAIGVIHFARGELDEAKERYDRSHEIWEKMGDRTGLVPTLNNIGELHLMRGEPEYALIVYGRSLVIAEKSNERIGSTSTLCGLALTYLELRDFKTALEHGERALKIALEAKSVSVEGKCRWVIGAIYREMGEHGKSEDMFRQSVKLLEECGNRGEEVYAQYEYGLLLAAVARPAEAKEHLEKSLRMFRTMGMTLWVRKAEEALRRLTDAP